MPVFWESGFIIEKGKEEFELVSAQKSGRVEVLQGKVLKSFSSYILDMGSISIVNDERMIRSARHFEFAVDRISYILTMSTTKHPELATHLTATLKKRAT